jgi:DNA-binding transcriptional LysR family regulator
MDSLQQVRAFVLVVDEGSFAAAARTLGVSRPALTRYVAQLEHGLGAQLLTRSTRHVGLTAAGRSFYGRARELLDAAAAAVAAVTEADAPFTGSLRVNAPMTFGTLYLATAVSAFAGANPGLRLELVLNDRFVDLIAEGFDVSVRIAEPEHFTSLVMHPLVSARRTLCAAPAYLAGAGPPGEPRDLKAHRILCYGYQSAGPFWRLEGPDGGIAVPLEAHLWSNNGEVLRHAALAGLGIAQLPTFIVGPDLAAGRLVPVLTEWTVAPLTIQALHARHAHVSPRVTAFVGHLAEWFGGTPEWDRDLPPALIP